jgi:Domain of unknown function (DUF4157)
MQRETPKQKRSISELSELGFDANPGIEQVINRGGQKLDIVTRNFLEPKFGHSFENVRIHADAESEKLSSNFGARAFAVENDLFFGNGEFNLQTSRGQHLLAHELVHVVQHNRFQTSQSKSNLVSDVADSAEVEASNLASRVVAGDSVSVSAAPAATVSRGILDWVEENVVDPVSNNASRLANTVANGASNAWEGMQSMAQDVAPRIVDEGTAMVQGVGLMATDLRNMPAAVQRAGIAEAREFNNDIQIDGLGTAVFNGAERAAVRIQHGATDIHDGMRQNAGYLHQGVQAVEAGIDTLEESSSSVIHGLAGLVEGVPLVGNMAEQTAHEADQYVQLGGGLAKGATTMVGGIGQMAANPVDALLGLEAMAEHTPGVAIPGNLLGVNPLRVAHGLYNAATTNVTLESEMSHAFDFVAEAQENVEFVGNLGEAIAHPYAESIQHGKPAEAAGRGIFDVGSLLLGVGETGAAARGGEAATLAVRAAEGAELASGAARVSEGVSLASKVAEGGELASNVSRAAEVSEVTQAAEVSEVVRTAEVGEAAGVGEATEQALAGEGRGSAQTSEVPSVPDSTHFVVGPDGRVVDLNRTVSLPQGHGDGVARQGRDWASIDTALDVENGNVYREGNFERQQAGSDGQYWQPSNPANNQNTAAAYGMPENNSKFDWLQTAKVKRGHSYVTRPAPGIGSNPGGAIEVVTPPNSVQLGTFHMPDDPL